MRVLFLTQIMPYPPDAGPRIKTWHVLRHLHRRGHEVDLVSFVRSDEMEHIGEVRRICRSIHTIPIRRSRLFDGWYLLRALMRGRPFLVERDNLSDMRKLVDELISKENYDIAHADQLTMAQFLLSARQNQARLARPSLVFDAHNAVWTIVEGMKTNVPPPLRPLLTLEARRIRAYEGRVILAFDHTLAVTRDDREALLQAAHAASNGSAVPPAISVIPIAVDTEALKPTGQDGESCNILTLGTLHYPPNADGIRWFAKEIFPHVRQLVPEASLTIVGKNPPPDFVGMERESEGAIEVTGYVPDLDPFMEEASIMVVPVRAGGGMKVRVLEGLARGMPMVTTTVGLAGIEARNGEEILVADDTVRFAAQTVRLLLDEHLRSKLSRQGRELAERLYDWNGVLNQLDDIYTA